MAVLLILLASVSIASAGSTAERTLPSSVVPGEEFTVTVDVSNYGALGRVVETLPAGFDYVSQSGALSAAVDGNEVTFNLLGTSSFSYNVVATFTEGTYVFSGTIEDSNHTVSEISGSTEMVVPESELNSTPGITGFLSVFLLGCAFIFSKNNC